MAYLSIIVPVYNQVETVLPFYYNLVKQLPEEFELIYVNDGSTDATETELEFLAKKDSRLRCINLTRNYGITAAVMAGMDHITGRHIVVMKGDLQNPAHLIPEMISQLEAGNDIVNTTLSNKLSVSILPRKIMDACYFFLQRLSGEQRHIDISEFRAYHNRVIDQLRAAHEKNLMPGLFFNWTDFNTTTLTYEKKTTSKADIRYTLPHLRLEASKAIKYSKANHLYSFVISGACLVVAGSVIIGKQLITQTQTISSMLSHTLLAGFLITTGIWLFIQSTYRFRILKELKKLYKTHQYVIRDVFDREHLMRHEFKEYRKVSQL